MVHGSFDVQPLPARQPGAEFEASSFMAHETGPTKGNPVMQEMVGWHRDLTVTGDREPILNQAEVQETWGLPYGKEMGTLLLPSRQGWVAEEHEIAKDGELHAIRMFDARTRPNDPPKFVVASEAALAKVAKKPPLLRGLYARLSGDIHVIHEGERVRVGTGKGRWMPSALAKAEKALQQVKGHKGRRVISDDQTLFYVGEDQQLHVRSEGYNPDDFVAIPNAAERKQKEKRLAYERDLASRVSAQHLGHTATATLPAAEKTQYIARHAN